MTQKYAVGDKVRILDVSKIGGASWENGDITKVIGISAMGNPKLSTYPADSVGLVIVRSELKYIEKVAEQMTKFNVGDTVRIVKKYDTLSGFNVGDIAQVYAAKHDGSKRGGHADYSVRHAHSRGHCNAEHLELVNAKSTQDKPKKKARISALEAKVAELTAKVEALEQAQKPAELSDVASVSVFGKPIGKFEAAPATFNEQRKAIIAEAKAFVEDAKNFTGGITDRKGYKYGATGNIVCDVTFEVNPKKRVVVALLKYQTGGRVAAKAIAKCAPDDVFNADIGKAIALGRALGLDVERFEQAVKPTEVVVGMRVDVLNAYSGEVVEANSGVKSVRTCGSPNLTTGGYASHYRILDDTEAQY